jgi:hypothetical protein
VIACLGSLSADDIRQFADANLFDASQRKTVSLMIFGNGHTEALAALKEGKDKHMCAGGDDTDDATGADFFPSDTAEWAFSIDDLTAMRDGLNVLSNRQH